MLARETLADAQRLSDTITFTQLHAAIAIPRWLGPCSRGVGDRLESDLIALLKYVSDYAFLLYRAFLSGNAYPRRGAQPHIHIARALFDPVGRLQGIASRELPN
jgi:hypothetical protein